ncbi:alpha/beta hydrolase [Massilia sp. BJB1822]|nr:alpha/beta hydrolase [Massilia sp. BJB1822]
MAGLGLSVLAAAAVLAAGELLSAPVPHAIGEAPRDLAARTVQLRVNADATVAGWYAPGQAGHGAVLLLHGVRADRRAMLDRARFLKRAGFSVLLIDLPSHGESSGERITFGWREAEGVKTALAFLRQELPGEKVGVIGVSLGAASLVLARDLKAPDAAVLESMYPAIEDAVGDRLALYLGQPARHLSPLLLWQLPLRTGIGLEQLRPEAALPALKTPLLIASGSADTRTPWHETQRLYAAAGQPKQLWMVRGADHVDLHAYAPSAYEAMVLAFLRSHLRGDAVPRQPGCALTQRSQHKNMRKHSF